MINLYKTTDGYLRFFIVAQLKIASYLKSAGYEISSNSGFCAGIVYVRK